MEVNMGLFDELFKNKAQKEKEKNMERRKALRQAERAVDDIRYALKDQSRQYKKEQEIAIAAKRSGNKRGLQRSLQSIRMREIRQQKLEKKMWVQEQFLLDMQMAGNDKAFFEAVNGFQAAFDIDVDAVEDVMTGLQDKLKDSGLENLTDRLARAYEREMEMFDEKTNEAAGLNLKDLEEEISEMAANEEAMERGEVYHRDSVSAPVRDNLKDELSDIERIMAERRGNR
jgi:hypothetical protein